MFNTVSGAAMMSWMFSATTDTVTDIETVTVVLTIIGDVPGKIQN